MFMFIFAYKQEMIEFGLMLNFFGVWLTTAQMSFVCEMRNSETRIASMLRWYSVNLLYWYEYTNTDSARRITGSKRIQSN